MTTKIIIALYVLLCATCAYLFSNNILPYPYTKVPVGILLGSLSSLFFTGLMLLGVNPNKHVGLIYTFCALAITIVLAFIQRLLPLSLDEFHVTTNVSRVSLITGMTIGALMVAYFKTQHFHHTHKISKNAYGISEDTCKEH
jgi:hypothetical protein